MRPSVRCPGHRLGAEPSPTPRQQPHPGLSVQGTGCRTEPLSSGWKGMAGAWCAMMGRKGPGERPPPNQPHLEQGTGLHAGPHASGAASRLPLSTHLPGDRQPGGSSPKALTPSPSHPHSQGRCSWEAAQGLLLKAQAGCSLAPAAEAGEAVSALLPLTTRMRTRSSGQCDSGATCRAMLSFPSARCPICHSTKPPCRLRQALPEPRRATSERSLSTPYTRARA